MSRLRSISYRSTAWWTWRPSLRKLADELAYLEGFLASVMKKLSNERFVSGAPQKVVETEYAKKNDAEAKIKALRERMAALK